MSLLTIPADNLINIKKLNLSQTKKYLGENKLSQKGI